MAKMWKVRGLDCDVSFEANARLVLATRIDELYSHASVLDTPGDIIGLHDLRISIKRLRYSIEFFSVCFDHTEVEWILAGFSELQDLLGDLHDADLFIPQLHEIIGEV